MSDSEPRPPDSRFRPFLGAAVLALLTLLATAGFKSYRDLAQARRHEARLAQQIAEALHRIELLDERIELLADDPATLERLAREDLGMVRPGDVVIVLPEEESP